MKLKTLTLLTCLAGGILLTLSHAVSAQDLSQLQINLSATKPEYVLGDMVTLNVTLANRSYLAIPIPNTIDVKHGNIKIYIAYESEGYKEYSGPQWGVSDVEEEPTNLDPGQSLTTKADLLFNHAPATSHLSPLYANREKQQKIVSDYAFPQIGHYRVYAALLNASSAPILNSPALNLTIKTPVTPSDIAYWNLMKSDAEYAYFVQTGKLRQPPQTAHSQLMLSHLQSFVSAYSTSPQGVLLAANLKRYHDAQSPTTP